MTVQPWSRLSWWEKIYFKSNWKFLVRDLNDLNLKVQGGSVGRDLSLKILIKRRFKFKFKSLRWASWEGEKERKREKWWLVGGENLGCLGNNFGRWESSIVSNKIRKGEHKNIRKDKIWETLGELGATLANSLITINFVWLHFSLISFNSALNTTQSRF